MDNGHLNELTLQDNSLSILSFFINEKKRLKKNDLHEKSILSKLIPSFLKFEENKELLEIKIDDQRNVVFTLNVSRDYDTMN